MLIKMQYRLEIYHQNMVEYRNIMNLQIGGHSILSDPAVGHYDGGVKS